MAQEQKTKFHANILEISREAGHQYFEKSIERINIIPWKSILKGTVLNIYICPLNYDKFSVSVSTQLNSAMQQLQSASD